MKLIPEETRIQQINALPNISFVRWAEDYKNTQSKAVCRCTIDGYEWSVRVSSLLRGYGCHKCAGAPRWTEAQRIAQINNLPNITFTRWGTTYKNAHSNVIVRCTVDGHEWRTTITQLMDRGSGCPKCAGVYRWSADERILQINAQPNIVFIRWRDGYKNAFSRAVCRCTIDGFEWAASISDIVSGGTGCPQCAGMRRWTAEERVEQINAKPNVTFVRWVGSYKTAHSKALCKCDVDGVEWVASVSSLLHGGSGCPRCAEYGFNPSKPGTLYILRSDCGSLVKIGISNDHEKRHRDLKRATPFDWSCIELLHGNGEAIADMEKELHSITEQATFSQPFDGFTEWRKWEPRLLKWVDRYRTRLARYNKAP